MVVTDVVKDSPAAKAGLLKHDVLLSVGDKSLAKLGDLREVVTASKGKSIAINFVRRGERQTLNVTPEKRTAARHGANLFVAAGADQNVRIWDALNGAQIRKFAAVRHPAIETSAKYALALTHLKATHDLYSKAAQTGLQVKLDRMIRQIQQLQESVDQLRKNLTREPAKSSNDSK